MYGICSLIEHVYILNYNRFGFESISQKMFEINFF
jgi:hypothetical protein